MKGIITGLSILLCICGCTTQTPPPQSLGEPPLPQQMGQQPTSNLILTDGERRWELNLADVGFDGVDPTTLDRAAFFEWLASNVESQVNRPPVSARFENRKPIPHRDGRQVDRHELEGWLDHIHEHVNQVSEVPIQVWKPMITTKTLLRIKEKRLGTYSTRYNPGNVNRTHNIHLSTKAMDHVVLPEGEIFSFNQIVGMRTPNRGYRPAPVIVRGEYTEGIGGGICQTSSTLFNSVERAGLRVIQRVSHTKNVTYVPPGRDATVSWGGPDFSFQNQLNQPILVAARANQGWLTVDIYGSGDTHNHPRSTPEPPKDEPKVEKVPPKTKQPLDKSAEEYRNPPLQKKEWEQDITE
ncbi:VanW family protein [Desmospora activa]|uniref:VanW like protein n=1 Tax=Desmospora activa DSM 45169 TaxID=1121389 RepID=A0A2T4ZBR7_9BACL|nr:VanW family protein [Desmospora activa]PTM59317.1 VanW like protein [Desmospora activa DSM 45169]